MSWILYFHEINFINSYRSDRCCTSSSIARCTRTKPYGFIPLRSLYTKRIVFVNNMWVAATRLDDLHPCSVSLSCGFKKQLLKKY